jgi:hypothetical protein
MNKAQKTNQGNCYTDGGDEVTKESILEKIKKHAKGANQEYILDKLEKSVSLHGFTNILKDYVGTNKLERVAK